jgi:hypothetical protein
MYVDHFIPKIQDQNEDVLVRESYHPIKPKIIINQEVKIHGF